MRSLTSLLLAASCAAVLLGTAQSSVIEPRLYNAVRFPDPVDDPFYKAPANLASLSRGEIIRERPVDTIVGAAAKSAHQILYRTEDSVGAPDAVVATVFAPHKPAPGPPKILAILLPQDSASFHCSASWALIPGTTNPLNTAVVGAPNLPAFYAALAQGWYIVAPDHEGSKATFIAGPGAGRASLDSISAILQHKATITASTAGYTSAAYGYSGGAHAAAWTNQLASSYGSSLNFAGAAYGGTVAYLRPVIDQLNKSPFAGFGGAGIAGLANAYKELDDYIKTVVRPNGTAALERLRGPQGCTHNEIGDFFGKDVYSYVTVPNVLDEPIPKKYIELNNLGKDVLQKPAFIYHAATDEVINTQQIIDYYNDQCKRGASSIQLAIADPSTHFVPLVTGLPPAFIFLNKILNGNLDHKGCSMTRGLVPSLSSSAAKTALGQQAVAASFALRGTKIGSETINF
ncbi:LIP-domain-containing protein [Ceraceosorus guamensis]|uniref:triacylglycerol lipase n=1 Tax=Ceraceosorus guamensis TaxID=1522189 RepID=A0A316W5L4_9BASI|nr:LIP-domain-containing protein [Ceraceosorus guamensis]PWN45250.1 LIP-domain-containing protein [Ceraceosorus guamensis]